MPTLYVANCTKQRCDFAYRVDGVDGLKRQMIPAGGQEVIFKRDAALEELNSIVRQHARYGLVRASEIDRTREFIGLCFDIDKPVVVEKIMYSDEHNMGILQERSAEERKLSGAALHDALERATERTPARLGGLSVEVTEQNGATEPGLNEIVEVSRDGDRQTASETGRRRRR